MEFNPDIFSILFEDLPPEINVWIETFFDKECRLRTRSVCKRWRDLYTTPNFDIYMPEASQMNDIIETFSGCQQLFSLKFHKIDKWPVRLPNLEAAFTKLTNLISLEFSQLHNTRSDPLFCLHVLPALQRVHGPVSIYMPLYTITSSLTYLDILPVSSQDKIISSAPNLAVLAGSFGVYEQTSLQLATNLTSLTIIKTSIDLNLNEQLNHLTNLKVLELDQSCTQEESKLDLQLPNLEVLEATPKHNHFVQCTSTRLTRLTTKTLFPSIAEHTTLKSLTVHIGRYSRTNDEDLEVLKSLPNLEEFTFGVDTDVEFNGKFLQFMNHQTLTRLSIGIKATSIDEISSFTNLRELNLVLQRNMSIEVVSTLSNLTRLFIAGIRAPELNWVNRLTKLRELLLDFRSLRNVKEMLDLADLTNLRTLVITPRTKKVVNFITRLIRLERLEFPSTNENIFHDQWLYLTALTFQEAVASEQVSKLTRLRELDYIVVTNDEIVQLTSLQKLTRFICRSTTANSMFLTLLTRLQSVAFSNVMSPADWATVQPWTFYNAYPDVVRKLPYFISGPKEKPKTILDGFDY